MPPSAALLALQRTAGNRAVTQLFRPPVAQRTELIIKGGGVVADVDGPGSNPRAGVMGVQKRLLALWSIPNDQFDVEYAKVSRTDEANPVLAADIPHTLAAIDRNAGPHLGAGPALGVFKAALIGGVGVGEPNNATDVELMLNLLHEEGHVTNDDYDNGILVLTGAGASVNPGAVPGFVAGLTKVKQAYVGGYQFRGTTATRKKPVAPDGPDQAQYEKAISHNTAERRVMAAWLAEAKAQRKDVMLRNSAEWCTTGKIVLWALTLTHDSSARAKASGKGTSISVFSYPGGPLGQPTVPYTRKAKGTTTYDNANVDFQAKGVAGFHIDNHITAIEPSSFGKASFFQTLKHESQHDADKSGAGDVEDFKSEFRAYWLGGTFNYLSARKKVKRLGFTWNQRQFGIFQHLMASKAAYPYMHKNWNGNVPGWRAMVVAFDLPESVNPVNSVRIENLREAIEACTTADCLEDDRRVDSGTPRNAKAAAVTDAIDKLDSTDRGALTPTLNQLALFHLAGRTLSAYLAIR